MSDLAAFVHMGGYAAYVWSSYALALVVIGGIVWWSARELRLTREQTLRRARSRAGSPRRPGPRERRAGSPGAPGSPGPGGER